MTRRRREGVKAWWVREEGRGAVGAAAARLNYERSTGINIFAGRATN